MLAEGIPGGFALLYDSLPQLETLGVCRRGYFIEGMGGAQFALPGAVERLRARPRDRGERRGRTLVLAAADPAQPYGAALPWPKRERGQERRPAQCGRRLRRLAGDEPALYVERGGRGLLTLADAPLERGSAIALGPSGPGGRRLGKLALERIDGEPAIASQLVGRSSSWASTPARASSRSAPELGRVAGALVLASWRRWQSSRTRPLRVGHKGAALLAPGNTLAAFRAALEAGVEMIEFDVLSEHRDGSGRLLLAHDYEAMHDGSPLTLEQGLAHLAGEEFAGVQLDVDVKIPGYGPRVVAALREAGLIERSLVSSMFPRSSTRCAPASRRCAWAGRCRGSGATTRPTCSPRSPRWRSSPATARCCPAAFARRCAPGASTRSWPTGAWSPRG